MITDLKNNILMGWFCITEQKKVSLTRWREPRQRRSWTAAPSATRKKRLCILSTKLTILQNSIFDNSEHKRLLGRVPIETGNLKHLENENDHGKVMEHEKLAIIHGIF